MSENYKLTIMKELSIAEKATRYDEALKEAVIAHKDEDRHLKATLERIFPELKESEDERIRKEIITFIVTTPKERNNHKKWIAWLEAQGEHDNFRNKIQIGDKVTRNEDGVLVNLSQLNRVAKKDEKQGKQKPADKVEPNFRKGDWVVYCNDDVDLITGIEENGYTINEGGYIPFVCASDVRLWTIQDAKDGDVLANDFHEIFIFKNIKEDAVISYCSIIDRTSDVIVNSFDEIEVGCTSVVNFYPATKEQRDTLMKAMTNAGYSFDFENKELKKIEQSHVDLPNGEDYGIDGLYAAVDILQKTLGMVDGYQTDDGILEHKCAINAVKELSKQKPADTEKGAKGNDREIPNSEPPLTIKHAKEVLGIKQDTAWSEEDEMFVHGLIRGLAAMKNIHGHTTFSSDNIDITKTIDWFKYLKERYTWKPSDEQMNALNYVVNLMASSERPTENDLYYNILKSLRQQLMKLKG